MAEAAVLQISNESEAWDWLHRLIAAEVPEGILDVHFVNWPILEVKLEGGPFQSTISPKMMEGFLALQSIIYRSYAQFKYNKPNINCLTAEDRRDLEFFVKVGEGSSKFDINLSEILGEFFKGIGGKMTGRQAVFTILGVSLMVAGVTTWHMYLENNREIKKMEIESFADEQETERMKILADALQMQPGLALVQEESNEVKNRILKGGIGAERMIVAGTSLDQNIVKKMVRGSRDTSIEIQLNGVYQVHQVGKTSELDFRVNVVSPDGESFVAIVSDKVITAGDHRSLLERALFEDVPVYLYINARKVRDQVTKATIVGVDLPENLNR